MLIRPISDIICHRNEVVMVAAFTFDNPIYN